MLRPSVLALLLFLGGAAAACGREGQRPSLLLVTLDTTRADALGCYAARPGLTPNLDRLASEGLVFECARSVAPLTLPAHASMLTGLYPPRHTLRDNGLAPLPASARTAAEELAAAGYETAAFVSAAVLDRSWGLAQGFELYDDPPSTQAGVHIEERPGVETVQHALDWLRSRSRERPFFVWVHLYEPHAPYSPPRAFLEQARGDAYLGEVAAEDHELGRLLDALRNTQELERTLVLVAADHGEALGQHGEPTHSIFCYEPTMRVPLIARLPGASRSGVRLRAPVSLVDLFPTLLAAAGGAPPPRLDGRDLLADSLDEERTVYFESYCGWLNYAWSPLCGAADQRETYLWSEGEELFDLPHDPRQKLNLAEQRVADCARWRERLRTLVSGPALARADGEHADEAQRARVRELGYAGSAEDSLAIPAVLEPTGLPSPMERKEELRRYYDALEAEVRGEHAQARQGLQEVLAGNPANYAAGDVLGALLIADGQFALALEVLQKLQASGRERATTHLSLAQCCEALGRGEEALAHLERALVLHPEGRTELRELRRVCALRGDTRRAAELDRRLELLDATSGQRSR